MRGLFRGILMTWTLALALPLLAADDKPEPKDKPESKEKPAVKDKIVSAGQYMGKMAKVPGTDKNMSLSVLVGRNNWKTFEIPVVDDLKVRLASPPPNFDEKGKPKRYSQKELAELRGPDRRLPGYTGVLEDLKNGQIVRVHLVKKAGPLPRGVAVKDLPPEYKPQVSMIEILAQAPGK